MNVIHIIKQSGYAAGMISGLLMFAGCASHPSPDETQRIIRTEQTNRVDDTDRTKPVIRTVPVNRYDLDGTLTRERRSLMGISGPVIDVTFQKAAPDIYRSERLAGRLDAENGQNVQWYRITLSEPGQLTVTVQHRSAGVLLLGEVYREYEPSPCVELIMRGQKAKTASLNARPGIYYARLSVESCQAVADYDILATHDKNGTAAGATTLPLGGKDLNGQLNGRIADRTDWYQVKGHVEEQGTLTYAVERQSGSPLAIEFYQRQPENSDEPQLLTPAALRLDQPGQKVSYAIATQPGGVYYARVNILSPEDAAAYTIRNSFQVATDTALAAAADFHPSDDAIAPIVSELSIKLRQGEVVAAGSAQDNRDMPRIQMRVNDTLVTPAGVVNSPETSRIEFAYTLTEWLQPGLNVIAATAVDAAGNASPPTMILFEKPVIQIQSAVPLTNLQRDRAGNVTRIETGADTLTIRYTAASSRGLRQGQVTCRCVRGCVLAAAADVASPQRAGRNVDDLMILATPPPSADSADAQTPQPQWEFTKTLILNESMSQVIIAAVDEAGALTEHSLTIVITSPFPQPPLQ